MLQYHEQWLGYTDVVQISLILEAWLFFTTTPLQPSTSDSTEKPSIGYVSAVCLFDDHQRAKGVGRTQREVGASVPLSVRPELRPF